MAIISIKNVRGVRRSCSILRHPVHLGRFCVRTCRSSFFYVPARFGADFLAAIDINRDLLTALAHPPGRRAGTQSPSHRDLLTALAHPPGRRAGTQSPPSHRDLLAALAHPPAACGGAGQISNKKPMYQNTGSLSRVTKKCIRKCTIQV